MDDLTIIMCMCIGNAVAWLMALYTPSGLHQLIWNVVFGMLGATLCALAIAWIAFPLGGVWLLVAGPPSAFLMIFAGHAIKRALQKGWLRSIPHADGCGSVTRAARRAPGS